MTASRTLRRPLPPDVRRRTWAGCLRTSPRASVYTYAGLVNALIPAAGFDQLDVDDAVCAFYARARVASMLMGACTASQNPGTPALKLTLAGADLVGGAMTAWSGPTYAIDGANQIMWPQDLATGSRAGLLTATFDGQRRRSRTARWRGYGAVAALAGGDRARGLLGQAGQPPRRPRRRQRHDEDPVPRPAASVGLL